MGSIVSFILTYGYAAMFGLLALGVAGVPVPDEVIMIAFGGLVSQGYYNFSAALIVTFCGSMTGMLFSYALGRFLGKPLLHKYGKWVRLTPKKIAVSENWFGRYGTWGILFGYFVPGLRHLSSYLAGTTRLKFSSYLLYATLGALIWCTTFLWVGHAVGLHWEQVALVMDKVTRKMGVAVILLMMIGAFIPWAWKKYKLKSQGDSQA
ncbi:MULTISPECIES: DedA family protein [Paenibacillus]|uniref:DedA family protein n=1 Tax=Paenibacillus TaxID=44249 RepID=UPI0003702354|nr:DedA family protein [Paenibacillus massiliensis]